MKDALKDLEDYNFTYISNHDSLINDLARLKKNTDFVFNLCDEGYNNDPRKELHVPSLLEMMDINYTGAGPQCLAFCYDKSLVRGIAKEMGIPVAKAFFIKPEDNTFELPFGFPVIVKPNFGDSSFGITQRSVCNGIEELVNAISEITGPAGLREADPGRGVPDRQGPERGHHRQPAGIVPRPADHRGGLFPPAAGAAEDLRLRGEVDPGLAVLGRAHRARGHIRRTPGSPSSSAA